MDEQKPFQFKVGDVLDSRRRIAFIYGHSPIWLVYEDENGHIQWHTSKNELSAVELEVNRHFDRLHAAIKTCLAAPNRKPMTELLAQAFYMALSQAELSSAVKHFDEVEKAIKAAGEARLRLFYVVSSTVATLILTAILGGAMILVGYPQATDVLIGACAASLGAWVSVLQRTSSLKMVQFDAPHYIAIQGVSRTLIGAIFGAVFVVATKAGLFLTVAADNVWATITFAFIAGISERFVPELLGRIESGKARTADKNP